MTYGEYYYLIKNEMRLKDGVWVTSKPNIAIPPKMKRKDALKYYQQKFNNYWRQIDIKSVESFTYHHD